MPIPALLLNADDAKKMPPRWSRISSTDEDDDDDDDDDGGDDGGD